MKTLGNSGNMVDLPDFEKTSEKKQRPDSPSDSKKMKVKIKGINLKEGENGDDQTLNEEENGSPWLTKKIESRKKSFKAETYVEEK